MNAEAGDEYHLTRPIPCPERGGFYISTLKVKVTEELLENASIDMFEKMFEMMDRSHEISHELND